MNKEEVISIFNDVMDCVAILEKKKFYRKEKECGKVSHNLHCLQSLFVFGITAAIT